MSSKIIIVDANVLVSAYGFDGEVRRYWREFLRACKIVVSPEILIEVESQLRNGEFNLAGADIRAILLDIIERCEIVRPNPPRDPKFQDLKDSHLAALAQYHFPDGASAAFLLTGDEGVLNANKIGNCEILSIAEFCNSGTKLT